eukprot:5200005-Heterocapsa_arctica.AAC.1
MMNQGQQTPPQTADAGTSAHQTADASTYTDIPVGGAEDEDELMGNPDIRGSHPLFEDRAAEIERLRQQAEAEIMARENQARERIEAMRLEARRQHAHEVEEAARILREQFERAEAEINAQRTAAAQAENQKRAEAAKKAADRATAEAAASEAASGSADPRPATPWWQPFG